MHHHSFESRLASHCFNHFMAGPIIPGFVDLHPVCGPRISSDDHIRHRLPVAFCLFFLDCVRILHLFLNSP